MAAMIVEAISYIVSLTDSIVTANLVDLEAFSTISLVSPFFRWRSFLPQSLIPAR